MRYLLFAGCIHIIVLMGYTGSKSTAGRIDQAAYSETILKKRLTSLNCSPDWNTFRLTSAEIEQMIPLPGTGPHKWKISTNNDSAQFYFNQGINLYYGFHIIEALPSFKKSTDF